MVQDIKRVALYLRVSTDNQETERQEADLLAFAERKGYQVITTFREKMSGTRNDRKERAKVMLMARQKLIDAILVTELSRWGRNTEDLLHTMQYLSDRQISLIALNGLDFDMSTSTGKLMLTILSGFAEFERNLIRERTLSGLAKAKAKGKKLGRQLGHNPSDKYAGRVLKMLDDGRSMRWIADELHISKTTVMAIKKRAA